MMNTTIWYRQLGFSENPFSIKPSKYADELVGYDLQTLHARVERGGLVFVEGVYGIGKTSLLRKIKQRFAKSHKVIYYACNAKEAQLDFDRLLRQSMGLLDSLLGREPRGVLLLLDEAQGLTSQEFRKLNYLYQSSVLKSVVLMADNLEHLGFPFDHLRTDYHCYRLDKLTTEQAVSLVRKRVGSLTMLSDDVIGRIFHSTGKNPRRLLKHCEFLCKYAVEHALSYVSESDLDLIFDFSVYNNGHGASLGDMRLVPRHQLVSPN